MDNETILVVDDDEKICQILLLYLRSKGYDVVTCKNGIRAISTFNECKPDLVLLDVMLPGLDGWEILSKIRRISNVPVIMLTAKGDVSDRIQGLDCGADDYIVKPFESKELIARIRAVMRRSQYCDAESMVQTRCICIGELSVDIDNFIVLRCGERVEMPPKEVELLYFLMQHPNKVLSRGQILDGVWGFDYYGDSRTIDVHIKRLRNRLGDDTRWRIRTIWSVGYKFECEESDISKT